MNCQAPAEVLSAIECVAGSWYAMVAAADSLASSLERLVEGQEDKAVAHPVLHERLVSR